MTESPSIAPTAAVLTVDEAAQLLRISRQSAYQAVRAGELPTVKIGRRLLVPRRRLEQLLDGDVIDSASPAGQPSSRATPGGQAGSVVPSE